MPCDASHHSYLLLHFVTICDLCSYEFLKDPLNVGCHTQPDEKKAKNEKLLLSFCHHPCRHETDFYFLFSGNWIQKLCSEHRMCVCVCAYVCAVSRVFAYEQRSTKCKQCAKQIMRSGCRACVPYAGLHLLPQSNDKTNKHISSEARNLTGKLNRFNFCFSCFVPVAPGTGSAQSNAKYTQNLPTKKEIHAQNDIKRMLSHNMVSIWLNG